MIIDDETFISDRFGVGGGGGGCGDTGAGNERRWREPNEDGASAANTYWQTSSPTAS